MAAVKASQTQTVVNIKDVLEVFTHAVMLDGEEDGVQDDAEGHDHIKEGVVDHFVEEVLKLQPHWIVYTASLTATTISVET